MAEDKASTIYQDGSYHEQNPTYHVEDSPFKATYIKKILQRNDRSFSTCCEVGCGAGEILNLLSKTYTEASFVGYEISPQAHELSKTRSSARLSFKLKDLFTEELASPYDLLLVIDVIEHVENFFLFLRKCKKVAKYVVFHIPLDMNVLSVLKIDSILSNRREIGHLHYFSPETALATLQESGYEILDHLYTPHWEGKISRILLSKLIGQRATARIFGRYSLMVLTRPTSNE